MQLRIYQKSLLVLLCCIAQQAYSQNTPVLSQTSASGTVTTTTTTPPAVTVSSSELYNYERTFVPRSPVTDAATLTTTSPAGQVAVSTRYMDGFKRTMETVVHHFHSGKSLVQPSDTRFLKEAKSYLPYTASGFGFRNNAFSEQVSYYSAAYPTEGTTAYNKGENLSSATQRAGQAYVAGKSQVGQARGILVKKTANNANEVRIWSVSTAGALSSPGYYPANELFGQESTSPEGGVELTYTNKDGQLIYKKTLLETIVAGTEVTKVEAVTRYVYDGMGRLRYVLTPRAMELTGTAASLTTTILNNLCFQYQYDAKSRLKAERKPGETAFTEIVYDRKDRVVLRRSPLEATMGKWEATFYDKNNRVIATSLYTSSTTQATWQSNIDAASPTMTDATNILYYFATDAGEKRPGTITGNDMMSYTYYDHYGYSATEVPVLGDVFSLGSFPEAPDGAEAVTQSKRTQGMVTASRVRVVKGSGTGTELGDWIETVNYYDDKGRVIQQRTRNATKSGTVAGKEMVCNFYNFQGKLLLSSHYHENKKTGHAANEYTSYSYDAITGRLTETGHKVNEDVWKVLDKYEYDDLGRVSRHVLGNYGEVQDYHYNIRGQVTGINKVYAETGNKESESRTFGESLKYDFGYSSVRYDGKLSGMVWRGAGGTAVKAMSYGYTYDKAGRLKAADFTQNVSGSTWNASVLDYSVSGLRYDVNGNIEAMRQRGVGVTTSGAIEPVNMDRLTYTYESQSNRLLRVYDTITDDRGIGDFINTNGTANDYAYDASGNLTQDANKGITAVTYAYFNKPQTVTFSNGNTIKYIYDAAGSKLQELVTIGSTVKRTDYVGNFIYENDVLQYTGTGAGRTVYNPADGSYKEEFFVKDHLGNVRSTVDVQTYPVAEYLATYEIASAELEGLVFERVSEIAGDNPDSPDPGNMQSGLLNGSTAAGRVGTSLITRVMAGDRVELNVNSYYNSYNPATDAPVSASTMLSSITSTLTGGAGGLGGSESHNPQLVNQLFNGNNYTVFSNMVNSATDPTKPKAYLNYILFNEQMQIVTTFSGAFQANGLGSWSEIGTAEPMEVPMNGYLAVYLTDGSTHDVYFDQLVLRLTKGRLLEESHYYPHGLPMGNIGSSAAGFKANRRKHQGNEYIKEAGLNWMDFNFRQYDPQIGRFLSVDPLAAAGGQEVHSPFAAMGNAPESMIDPNGTIATDFPAYAGRGRMNILSPPPFLGADVQALFSGEYDAVPSMAWVGAHEAGGSGMSNESFWEAKMNGFNILLEGSSITFTFNDGGVAASNFSLGGLDGGEEGDKELTSYKDKDGRTIYNRPGGGIVKYKGFRYDLNAFEAFYNKYEYKFPARKVYGDNVADISDLTIGGKRGILYSEVGTFLSLQNGDLLTVGANIDPSKRGTSYSFNNVAIGDMFVPVNKQFVTLHIHRDFNLTISYTAPNGLPFSRTPGIGPSSTDSHESWRQSNMRSVIVDATYIYLYGRKIDPVIIIKR